MRFVSIAVFLLCVHVSMALVNATGVFVTTIDPAQDWFEDIDEQQLNNQAYVPNQVGTTIDLSLGDVVKGIFYFVLTFGASIVFLPWTLVQFGMDWTMASLLSLPFYMMYLLGWLQLLSNRAEKSMG